MSDPDFRAVPGANPLYDVFGSALLHVEDLADIVATAAKIQQEVQWLRAERSIRSQLTRLQRISVLARYLQEHLAMMEPQRSHQTTGPRAGEAP